MDIVALIQFVIDKANPNYTSHEGRLLIINSFFLPSRQRPALRANVASQFKCHQP